jgi:hypothetical protein
MYDLTNDVDGQPDMVPEAPGAETDKNIPERDQALVKQKIQIIRADKAHHDKAFKRMRRDMQVATWGAEDTWSDDNYRANIVGRHVKMKTAALYAKNPKAVAKRKETLDFTIWDENPESMKLAFQTVQMATAVAQQTAQHDAMAGFMPPEAAAAMPAPQMPPGWEQAQALLQDFQQGMQRRQMLKKYGETLRILFTYALGEQKPVDFKRGMKQLVRRTCTTGVGYVELGFQRETGPRPGLTEQLADARTRLDHLRNLAQQAGAGEIAVAGAGNRIARGPYHRFSAVDEGHSGQALQAAGRFCRRPASDRRIFLHDGRGKRDLRRRSEG